MRPIRPIVREIPAIFPILPTVQSPPRTNAIHSGSDLGDGSEDEQPDGSEHGHGRIGRTSTAALAAAGITRACNPPDNDLFCPDDPVTRGQVAAFINRTSSNRSVCAIESTNSGAFPPVSADSGSLCHTASTVPCSFRSSARLCGVAMRARKE
jgi:hypothetical protein